MLGATGSSFLDAFARAPYTKGSFTNAFYAGTSSPRDVGSSISSWGSSSVPQIDTPDFSFPRVEIPSIPRHDLGMERAASGIDPAAFQIAIPRLTADGEVITSRSPLKALLIGLVVVGGGLVAVRRLRNRNKGAAPMIGVAK